MIDLNWFGWLLVGFYALTTLLSVAHVGKPKRPTEPGEAVIIIILNALIIAGIMFVGTAA